MFDRMYTNCISIRGLSHIDHDLPNQDATLCIELLSKTKKKYTIIAVMDGVSSCAKADEASQFLSKTAKDIFEDYICNNENDTFSLLQMENLINNLFEKYVQYIVGYDGEENEYASTLEMIVITGNKAYTLHAGDGVLVLLLSDGHIVISSAEGHAGDTPGVVYSFLDKRRWEFHEYENVVSAFVASDGVYGELIPAPAQRNGYSMDGTLMLPMIDMRAHRSKKSMYRFQKSYIKGELNDKAIHQACARLLSGGIIIGISKEELKKHFEICQPYRKFCHSRDDLSMVYWVDSGKLPKLYDVREFVPNYFEIWIQENKDVKESVCY